jgi:hypothetical protein
MRLFSAVKPPEFGCNTADFGGKAPTTSIAYCVPVTMNTLQPARGATTAHQAKYANRGVVGVRSRELRRLMRPG